MRGVWTVVLSWWPPAKFSFRLRRSSGRITYHRVTPGVIFYTDVAIPVIGSAMSRRDHGVLQTENQAQRKWMRIGPNHGMQSTRPSNGYASYLRDSLVSAFKR